MLNRMHKHAILGKASTKMGSPLSYVQGGHELLWTATQNILSCACNYIVRLVQLCLVHLCSIHITDINQRKQFSRFPLGGSIEHTMWTSIWTGAVHHRFSACMVRSAVYALMHWCSMSVNVVYAMYVYVMYPMCVCYVTYVTYASYVRYVMYVLYVVCSMLCIKCM